MKYTGTIIGLKSSTGNIYTIPLDDKNCYAWRANVTAEIEGKNLQIKFFWNGDSFSCNLKIIKENYYSGSILFNGENGGKIYLWNFTKDQDLILKGDFVEDDAGTYNCFIELKPQ